MRHCNCSEASTPHAGSRDLKSLLALAATSPGILVEAKRKHKHNSGNLDIQLPMITENQGLTKGHRQHALRKKHQHQPEAQKKRNLHLACTQSFKAPGCASFSFTSSWRRPDHKEGPGLRQVSLHAHPRATHLQVPVSTLKMGPSNRTKAECRNRVQEKTKFGKKHRKTPAPQAHFTSPSPPRPSRWSVSDGVIQLVFVLEPCLAWLRV